MRVRLTLLISVLSLCGCGTILNFKDGVGSPGVVGAVRQPTQPYGGVKNDLDGIMTFEFVLLWPTIYTMDIPLSAVADTLTLPVTIPMAIARDSQHQADVASITAATLQSR